MDCTYLQKEYFQLLGIVADFDQRLFLVKGWGVTFCLTTLLLGAQRRRLLVLLVAATSSLSFWLVEGVVKGRQMRYYPRMADIETACAAERGGPRIHQSWEDAIPPFFGAASAASAVSAASAASASSATTAKLSRSYYLRWFFPAVALPHAITMFFSLLLAWQVWRRLRRTSTEA